MARSMGEARPSETGSAALLSAVREELGEYETRTDEIFEIVKNQREY